MDPTTFDDTYFDPDSTERENWQGSKSKKLTDMKKQEDMKKKDLPFGIYLLGNKWVFKWKKNGIFHAQLVAKGYNQIPSVEFTESFTPVVNDITIKTNMMFLLYNLYFLVRQSILPLLLS